MTLFTESLLHKPPRLNAVLACCVALIVLGVLF